MKILPLLFFVIFSTTAIISNPSRSENLNHKYIYNIDGFQVDFSRIESSKISNLLPGYISQIKIIQSAALPDEMLKLMKEIPIIVDPKKPQKGSHALFSSKYNSRKGAIFADLRDLPVSRPILLHEMIHAWDWNKYDFDNETIIKSYEEAKSSGIYPNLSSHFMKNHGEYFAISSTIYLTGSSEQPPFNCNKLARNQPAYIAFLERLYGDHGFCH